MGFPSYERPTLKVAQMLSGPALVGVSEVKRGTSWTLKGPNARWTPDPWWGGLSARAFPSLPNIAGSESVFFQQNQSFCHKILGLLELLDYNVLFFFFFFHSDDSFGLSYKHLMGRNFFLQKNNKKKTPRRFHYSAASSLVGERHGCDLKLILFIWKERQLFIHSTNIY